MEPFTDHQGIGVPLMQSNVDTDQIIPATFLKRITKTGFDDALFYSWRQQPDFIINQEPYSQGSVLVAGPDFGTGSSREHAVWALRDYGFKVVISSRFADIFYSNCAKQGVVAATVAQDDVERIWKELTTVPGTEVSVDLRSHSIRCGSVDTTFMMDPYTTWRLLEGLDDISVTLQQADVISAFEKSRPTFKPRTLPALAGTDPTGAASAAIS